MRKDVRQTEIRVIIGRMKRQKIPGVDILLAELAPLACIVVCTRIGIIDLNPLHFKVKESIRVLAIEQRNLKHGVNGLDVLSDHHRNFTLRS